MPDSNNCFWHLSAVANFTKRNGFCSILGKNTAFCVYSVHMKYWCPANSNLAYFIEFTTTLESQKQLLMSSILNLGGRESREIAVKQFFVLSNIYRSSATYYQWRSHPDIWSWKCKYFSVFIKRIRNKFLRKWKMIIIIMIVYLHSMIKLSGWLRYCPLVKKTIWS